MRNNPDFQAMKASIQDFTKPKAFVYWFDLILSSSLAWGLFLLAMKVPTNTIIYYFMVFLSAVGLYRASAFTHELVHMKKNAISGFYTVWHLVCGVPLLAPHFLYKDIHIAHHSKKDFGKSTDGEYIEFGTKGRSLMILHFLYNFIIPFLSIFRFMIIAPVSLLQNKLRIFVMENLSFMGLKFTFTRKAPANKSDKFKWYAEEFSCCLFLWVLFGLYISERLPVIFLFQWYAVVVTILTLNSLRTLGATHWYTSTGNSMGMEEQVEDSINIRSKSIFTQILCPVGTQFHALHHMFPSIPYHYLRPAYECLIKEFPNEKILTDTTKESLFDSWQIALFTSSELQKERLV